MREFRTSIKKLGLMCPMNLEGDVRFSKKKKKKKNAIAFDGLGR